VNPAGLVADVGALGLGSPNRDVERHGSLFDLLPWAIGGAWTLVIVAWVIFNGASRPGIPEGDSIDEWRWLRDEIGEDVLQGGFDRELGSFVQA